MGLDEPFLYKIVPAVVDAMKVPYPELAQTAANVATVIKQEEETFFKVIERGMKHVDRFIKETRESGQTKLDAEKVAHFYQTYGVPPELTTSVAAEFGMEMDWEQFEDRMQQHGKASGSGTVGVMGNDGPVDMVKQEVKKTTFVGYEHTTANAVIKGCGTISARLPLLSDAIEEPQFIILNQTPFYAKSGGQESDGGIIKSENGMFEITALQKTGDVVVHYGKMASGTFAEGETVEAIVDSQRRRGLCRAHSATHVLHHGLQATLGSHAQQRGSKVESDELRFDFSNDAPVSLQQLETIEHQVNQHVSASAAVESRVVPLEQAKAEGAMMLFGEKYPDPVRMVSIGDFSKELCGGTHLADTAEIEAFEIISEESVSAGVRRIVAYTGQKAKENQQQLQVSADRIARLLDVEASEIPAAAEVLVKRLKALKKQATTGVAAGPVTMNKSDTGQQSFAPTYFQVRDSLRKTATKLNVTLQSVEQRIQAMVEEQAKLLQQIEATKGVAAISADDLIDAGERIDEVLMVTDRIDGASVDMLKRLVDQIRKKSSPVVIVLASETTDGKVLLIVGVSKDLVQQGIKAGDIVKQVAPIVGGGGGGKPDLAQAGGKDPSKISDAIKKAKSILEEKLTS
jgi:alanyl-tRNA synthetase